MTEEEYIDILKKQDKSITEEIQKEIDEQVKLSEVANKKRNIYYVSLDKEIELLNVGCAKFFAKYPELKGTLSTQESLVGASQEILLKAISAPNYQADIVSKKYKKTPSSASLSIFTLYSVENSVSRDLSILSFNLDAASRYSYAIRACSVTISPCFLSSGISFILETMSA